MNKLKIAAFLEAKGKAIDSALSCDISDDVSVGKSSVFTLLNATMMESSIDNTPVIVEYMASKFAARLC
ncbi:hypothetical protein T4D_4933 [Trichinella pseudospiralis]|uniref:Uncharacterized protein n=2 Tax=Trichinella pseudospiralis TaxID=6337 RepID=A0A0V1F602_TRIPS|nr:hypothetical protein T4D_4933 [Trichinella pseudospiralis]